MSTKDPTETHVIRLNVDMSQIMGKYAAVPLCSQT
jgi:hypothetical protein